MSQEREPIRRELTLHSLFGHLWLLALFGGLIALFTSINSEFSPYFYWPFLVPAAISVIAVIAWALWRDLSTTMRQTIAALLVLAGAWLVIGPWLSGFANLDFMPGYDKCYVPGDILPAAIEVSGTTVDARAIYVRRDLLFRKKPGSKVKLSDGRIKDGPG